MEEATTQKSNRKGRFAKGASGNPAGRPPGSRNKASLLMEALLEDEVEQLTRKAIELAVAGDTLALRLCLDRILPPRKDRPINLSLHPIETMPQVCSAMSTVMAAIGDGRITPAEGETLAKILTVQTTLLKTDDLERRIEELEKFSADNAEIRKAQRPKNEWELPR